MTTTLQSPRKRTARPRQRHRRGGGGFGGRIVWEWGTPLPLMVDVVVGNRFRRTREISCGD